MEIQKFKLFTCKTVEMNDQTKKNISKIINICSNGQYDELFLKNSYWFYVNVEKETIGCARASIFIDIDKKINILISHLGVLPEFRRRKAATLILKYIIHKCTEHQQPRSITIQAKENDYGIQEMYSKTGFEVVLRKDGYIMYKYVFGPSSDMMCFQKC